MSIVIIGAGGHGRVLLEALRGGRARGLLGFTDADPSLHGRLIDSLPVLGSDAAIDALPRRRTSLVNGLGVAQGLALRRRVFLELRKRGFRFPPVSAPSACVARTAELGEGSQILTRAVVHPGARIGDNAVVNTGAVIEHDVSIGDHAFIAPGAVLCGGVVVGEGSFVGAGAVVCPGVVIGAGARIGAGGVLLRDAAPGRTMIGVPAREVRKCRT
ncbi:MAG: acetyltransferase [Elusimicrobiota bacterium]|jgi:UDP-perosamine 4-acetyltransferase